MEDIFLAIMFVGMSIYVGITEEKPLFGLGMAVASVAVVLLMRLWRNFWARHPKLAKAGKTLFCILFVIGLAIAGVPIIPLAVGAVLLIGLIQFISDEHQRDKQRTEEWLDGYRERLHERSEDSRRRDELNKQKREAAKAEAARLENLARQWERNAEKYGAPSDIQKAQYYREQANAAKRKLW